MLSVAAWFKLFEVILCRRIQETINIVTLKIESTFKFFWNNIKHFIWMVGSDAWQPKGCGKWGLYIISFLSSWLVKETETQYLKMLCQENTNIEVITVVFSFLLFSFRIAEKKKKNYLVGPSLAVAIFELFPFWYFKNECTFLCFQP